jgi:hypothetical protein
MVKYKPGSRVIQVGERKEIMQRSMGGFFLETFKEVALLKALPKQASGKPSIKDDWETIKRWVGATSDKFNAEQLEKWEVTYLSFLAEGRAPSKDLEEGFLEYPKWAKEENWPIIALNDEIRGVCVRLFVSDKPEPKKTKAIPETPDKNLEGVTGNENQLATQWKNFSPETRKWIFGCGVWAIFSWIVFSVFDPLDWGSDWGEQEQTQVAFTMALPFCAWGLKLIFDKYVR